MKYMKFDNIKLFEFIYESVIQDGGDGDATMIFQYQDHKVVADEFEIWLKTNSLIGWHRTNNEKDVVFSNHTENFMLTNERWDKNPIFSPERLLVIY